MRGINSVNILGRVGKDPELKNFSGTTICKIVVATSDSWKDKNNGETKKKTEWHKITFFEPLATVANNFLRKGSIVYVEGALQTRKYDNNGQAHYITEIIGKTMQLINTKNEHGNSDYMSNAYSECLQDVPF